QDGDGMDVGTADSAFLVDPPPGDAVVGAAPRAAFLDPEPDLGIVRRIDADREDARSVDAVAELGDLGRQLLPATAAVGRAEDDGAGGSAGAGIDERWIDRVDGDRPDRKAIHRRIDQ